MCVCGLNGAGSEDGAKLAAAAVQTAALFASNKRASRLIKPMFLELCLLFVGFLLCEAGRRCVGAAPLVLEQTKPFSPGQL